MKQQDTAETMRHPEETTVAAMVGWAKAAAEVERLTAERDRAKGIAEGLHKELRDAVAARGQAEAERDEARSELDLMTAERDSWRAQLSADWQAKQIHDLMAAVGRAHEERDEALARAERHRQARDAIGDPFARIGIIVDEWQENGGDPFDAMKAIAEQVGEP